MTALIDTGFFYALLDADDKNHASADKLLRGNNERNVLVSAVVPEAAYLIGTRLGYSTAIRFVTTLADSPINFELVTAVDLRRVAEIMQAYADSRLDFVDCALMAVAERLSITQIWTFDRRDFSMVRPRHTAFFELLP